MDVCTLNNIAKNSDNLTDRNYQIFFEYMKDMLADIEINKKDKFLALAIASPFIAIIYSFLTVKLLKHLSLSWRDKINIFIIMRIPELLLFFTLIYFMFI